MCPVPGPAGLKWLLHFPNWCSTWLITFSCPMFTRLLKHPVTVNRLILFRDHRAAPCPPCEHPLLLPHFSLLRSPAPSSAWPRGPIVSPARAGPVQPGEGQDEGRESSVLPDRRGGTEMEPGSSWRFTVMRGNRQKLQCRRFPVGIWEKNCSQRNGASCPESLKNLHHWRYLNLDWVRLWAAWFNSEFRPEIFKVAPAPSRVG